MSTESIENFEKNFVTSGKFITITTSNEEITKNILRMNTIKSIMVLKKRQRSFLKDLLLFENKLSTTCLLIKRSDLLRIKLIMISFLMSM